MHIVMQCLQELNLIIVVEAYKNLPNKEMQKLIPGYFRAVSARVALREVTSFTLMHSHYTTYFPEYISIRLKKGTSVLIYIFYFRHILYHFVFNSKIKRAPNINKTPSSPPPVFLFDEFSEQSVFAMHINNQSAISPPGVYLRYSRGCADEIDRQSYFITHNTHVESAKTRGYDSTF